MLTPRKTTLLIIENVPAGEGYWRQLRQEVGSYQFLTGAYGTQALEVCRSHPIDSILLRLSAPYASSLDFLQQLKHQLGADCPPLIAIGNGDAQVAVQAFKKGATDYLVEERITLDELRLTIGSAIENARLRRELQLSQEQLQISVENMLDCFGIFSATRDVSGQIVDFRIDYLNQAAYENNQMLGEMQVGRGLCEVFPGHQESGLFDEYCQLVETGEPLVKESLLYEDTYGDQQRLVRAFDIHATKLNDGFVASWWDITHRKQIEVALQQKVQEAEASKQTLDALMEYIPEGITIADAPDVKIRKVSRHGQELTGRSPEVLENISVEVHPDAWKIFHLDGITPATPEALPLTRAIQQGEVVTNEEWVLQKIDGQKIVILCNAGPIRDADGEITGGIIAWRDISDRKRTEDILRQSQEQLEMAMEAAEMGSWEWDIQTNEIRWSASLERLFGMAPNSFDGRYETVISMIHPEDLSRVQQALYRAAYEREDYHIEFRFLKPDGTVRWALGRGQVSFSATGKPLKMTGIDMDITARKQAEDLLRENEERFRTLADNISQFAWMADTTGWIFWYNQRWFDYTGTTLDEMQGWGWQQVHHPDHVDRVVKEFRRCIETGETWEDTFPLRSQDGQYRWFLSRAIPLRDEQGRVVRWFGTNTDITERLEVEENLQRSEAEFRMISNAAPAIVWVCDTEGRNIFFNDRWYEYTGQTKAQAAEYGWIETMHPEDTPQIVPSWKHCQKTGEIYEGELRYRRHDGEYYWHAFRALPRRGITGEIEAWYGLSIDISDRKQAEVEREQLLKREQAAREEAERANRIKDDFLAILSHELRSPLNPILGWAKLLQTRSFDAAKTAAALAAIERNARAQTQLIDDLLNVAKILRGKLTLEMAPTDLAFVVEVAIDTVSSTAAAKNILLYSEIPQVGQVSGDAVRLQQIIWNLLSNAIKFTPHGGQVSIRLERAGDQAQITVSDTGKGIQPEFLPYVFESFRQEDTSITRQFGGLGLGLAIVRQLVEAHGGTISAASPGEGLGATFTVCLPLLKIEPDPQPTRVILNQGSDLTGIRILIADDEPDARELLAVVLTQYGAEVMTISSAADVLNTLASFQPDLLVSDIGMPDVDGYALIQRIRNLPPEQGGQIPAIALTAYARQEDHQRALTSGYQCHITKPLDPEQLVQAAMMLISRSP